MRAIRSTFLAVAIVAGLPGVAAGADTPGETRLREALRSATMQVRSLEDEKAQWQAREALGKKELDALRGQLATAQRKPARNAELSNLTQRLAEQGEAGARLKEMLASCQASASEAADTARVAEGERAKLQAQATSLGSRVAACEAKNAKLYAVGKELLQWLFDSATGKEILNQDPFFGLARVELENTAQDYQDKLLEQRVRP
jgi:chromosome segregation ATPase